VKDRCGKNTGMMKRKGGAIPPLPRNCDGNESRVGHCPVKDGKAGE